MAQWQQSLALLFDAPQHRIVPTVVSFNAAMNAANDWQVPETLHVFRMPF